MFLTDAKINKSSLNNIKNNINKYSPHPEKVKIIAVTKTFSHQSIKSAEENKIFYIGENKVQETQKKTSNYTINPKTKLCLIGHLQSNKASLAVGLYSLIQSVDSMKILKKLNTCAQKQHKIQQVFLQLNITNSPTQTGFKKEEIMIAAEQAQKLPFIQTKGIMAIGANTLNEKTSKQTFKKTRKIQQKIKKEINPKCKELSLGMSGDYLWALQEGSTQLRLGTILFKKRNE